MPIPPTDLPAATHSTEAVDGAPNNLATLNRSIDECGFVAIGVHVPPDRPGEHERVAQLLAEAHGGQLTAVSPGSGLGSTFTLSLPIRRRWAG